MPAGWLHWYNMRRFSKLNLNTAASVFTLIGSVLTLKLDELEPNETQTVYMLGHIHEA